MSISQEQYADILESYKTRRRDNRLKEQQRKDEIWSLIPDIRRIDESIAHISMQKARQMVLHPDPKMKEDLHREIETLSMEKVNLLVLHGYPADYLDPIYSCPICRDTGSTAQGDCRCFRRHVADILYDQSNLREILARENFNNFRTDYYSDRIIGTEAVSPRDNILHILKVSRDFIRDFSTDPGQNLLLYGSAGVGKTFLSHCIADQLLKGGNSVIYLTAWQFFHQLERFTFDRDGRSEDVPAHMQSCDLLIIDDLGTELNNAFVNSQLFLCMNERILRHKSTIISTNLSLKQISAAYTERVSSRIIEYYTLLHMYGEDIRVKKAVSSLDE
ncbi:MAG: ATP-binding protein [Eubacterium sp.]|nr:ATP-binding protein [Eubacterium sp.]